MKLKHLIFLYLISFTVWFALRSAYGWANVRARAYEVYEVTR